MTMPPTAAPPSPRSQTAPDGPILSRIVAGMWRMAEWNMTPARRVDFVEQCIGLGVTTFDHADIYGGYRIEALFGEALHLQPSLRARIELVSKCGIKLVSEQRPAHRLKQYDSSAEHIIASAEHSLRQFGTDYLDLLLLHRPDPLMQFDEVAGAFTRLRASGKVRHFGVSNFSRHQFDCLHKRFPLAVNQVECSPLHLEPLFDGTFDGLQDAGVAPMIWSPLAGGRLLNEGGAAGARVRPVIEAIAARLERPFVSVVLAWLMQLPSRPLPLTGSGRIAAIRDAVAATAFTLPRSDWFAILEAARGHEVA